MRRTSCTDRAAWECVRSPPFPASRRNTDEARLSRRLCASDHPAVHRCSNSLRRHRMCSISFPCRRGLCRIRESCKYRPPRAASDMPEHSPPLLHVRERARRKRCHTACFGHYHPEKSMHEQAHRAAQALRYNRPLPAALRLEIPPSLHRALYSFGRCCSEIGKARTHRGAASADGDLFLAKVIKLRMFRAYRDEHISQLVRLV